LLQLLSPDAGGLWRSGIVRISGSKATRFSRENLTQLLDRLHDGLGAEEHQQFLTRDRCYRQPPCQTVASRYNVSKLGLSLRAIP
jgi:hypothetical protein